MDRKVFCLGWYGHGNLGDEAFKDAFTGLWPRTFFTFGDKLPSDINAYHALFVGGGSFLDQQLKGLAQVTIPIGFIGVGIGSFIHPDNKKAMERAKLVIARDQASGERWPSALVAGDLVLSRPPEFQHQPNKKIAVLCNDFLSPGPKSQEWQFLSYYRFCGELAKILDRYADQGYQIDFIPMCVNLGIDDRRASSQVISRMVNRKAARWRLQEMSQIEFECELSKSEFVITQRLHGAIFSLKNGIPFLTVSCHDKMAGLVRDLKTQAYVDYYGFTDPLFVRAVDQISSSVATEYVSAIRSKWQCMSDTVASIFSL